MKTTSMRVISVATLLIISFTAAAQKNPARYFKKLDANENGVLDETEFQAHSDFWMDKRGWEDQDKRARVHKSTFKKRDLNDDGEISLKEFIDTSKK